MTFMETTTATTDEVEGFRVGDLVAWKDGWKPVTCLDRMFGEGLIRVGGLNFVARDMRGSRKPIAVGDTVRLAAGDLAYVGKVSKVVEGGPGWHAEAWFVDGATVHVSKCIAIAEEVAS